jgi:hypothetical protein
MMATKEERDDLIDALEAISESQVWDLPTGGYLNSYQCPLCDTPLLTDMTFDEMEKVKTWTVAQLLAWHNLQKNSGIDAHELLARTSVQDRPGIGALVNPTVLGVDLNGIFVGIETDGYAHS